MWKACKPASAGYLACPRIKKEKWKGKIKKTFDEIVSEDRIGKLIDLYKDAILAFKPSKNAEQFNFERLLLRGKSRKTLRIGFIPGIILKIVQRMNYSRKYQ